MSDKKKDSPESPDAEKKELPFLDPSGDRSNLETQPMEALKLPPKMNLPGMKLPSQEESERATQPLAAFRDDPAKKPKLPFVDSPPDRSGMATEALEAIQLAPVEQLKKDDQGHPLIPMTLYLRKTQIEHLRRQLKELNCPEISIDALIRAYIDVLKEASFPAGVQSEKALLEELQKQWKERKSD